MIKEIVRIMDKKERLEGIGVLVVLLIGALLELLGVSAILPLVELMIHPESVSDYVVLVCLMKRFGWSTTNILCLVTISLIAVYLIKNIFVGIMYKVQFRFTYKNQSKLATEIFHNYISQNYLYHTSKNVAEIQRDIDKDVFNFYAVILSLIQLVEELLVTVLLVFYLAMTDWATTIIVAGMATICLGITTHMAKKKLAQYGENVRYFLAQSSKWVLQGFAGIKDVKASDAELFFESKFSINYNGFARNQEKAKFYEIIPKPIMETACITAILLPLAGRLMMGKSTSSFISTLSVFAIAAIRLLPCFNRMSSSLNIISEHIGTIDSIKKGKALSVSNEQTLSLGKCERLTFNNEIQIKNVSFHYPGSENYIFKDISMKIKKNSSIGIIGASGVGKTTLIDIILGLLELSSGSVCVDNRSIQDNIIGWHKIVSYIPQNIYLMDDSIKNNIVFGEDGDIDEGLLVRCLEDAQMGEFINELPEGVSTVIGDRGVRLSGGQRQRIGIARALYRKPEVLILDEATSALDNATERAVMDAVDNLQGKMTIIIVAHRLTTIEKCDYIYEVKNQSLLRIDKDELRHK